MWLGCLLVLVNLKKKILYLYHTFITLDPYTLELIIAYFKLKYDISKDKSKG